VIKPGEEWGTPTSDVADAVVTGSDTDLAAAVPIEAGTVPLVRFRPQGSELVRAVGLSATTAAAAPRGIALPVDAIETDRGTAMNIVLIGRAPGALRAWHRLRHVTVTVDGRPLHDGPASTVVIANGQYLGTADLVPRGHPGDGRLEVQVYALTAGERAGMRSRLPTGTHVPHPRIATTSGRTIEVRAAGHGLPLVIDGRTIGPVAACTATVRHPALRLLI
jgi:hypothetical protein